MIMIEAELAPTFDPVSSIERWVRFGGRIYGYGVVRHEIAASY